jgi:hypothetical protein
MLLRKKNLIKGKEKTSDELKKATVRWNKGKSLFYPAFFEAS